MSNNIERRVMAHPVALETRDDDKPSIRGMASVFDQETRIAFWDEVIKPGAFDDADMSDVRALFNHDPSRVLGRSKSGTLKLNVRSDGLFYDIDPPDTTEGRDLVTLMKRGDVDQSSFAFTVQEQKWVERKGAPDLREITKIDKVYDVSPVTYPAYDGTSSEARSQYMNLDAAIKTRGLSPEQLERKLKALDNELFYLRYISPGHTQRARR